MRKKIELNKEYTYADICKILGWQVATGNTKKSQIKQIEYTYEFYHPMNPKTKKPKKSYIFTAKTGKTYKSNCGGKRDNAGRKGKSIIQLDINGEFINEFASITSAEKTLHISHIWECLNGRTKTVGGFQWRYKE